MPLASLGLVALAGQVGPLDQAAQGLQAAQVVLEVLVPQVLPQFLAGLEILVGLVAQVDHLYLVDLVALGLHLVQADPSCQGNPSDLWSQAILSNLSLLFLLVAQLAQVDPSHLQVLVVQALLSLLFVLLGQQGQENLEGLCHLLVLLGQEGLKQCKHAKWR